MTDEEIERQTTILVNEIYAYYQQIENLKQQALLISVETSLPEGVEDE